MITTWLLRTLLVGLLLWLAALIAERVAGWSGMPRRWVWAAAMMGSLAVPLLAMWTPSAVPQLGLAAGWVEQWGREGEIGVTVDPPPGVGVAERTARVVEPQHPNARGLIHPFTTRPLDPISNPSLPAADPHRSSAGLPSSAAGSFEPAGALERAGAASAPEILTAAEAREGGSRYADPPVWLVLIVWMVSSLTVLGFIIFGTVRLRLLRSESTPAVVEGVRVRLSRGLGPAVVGLVRPEVVVPRWVLGVPAEERRLILVHEREHIEARDGWLLALSMLMLAAMPWNLPLWWQHRRLRLAVETDCDARVVANGASRRAYGEVLLRAASGAPVLPWLSPAWGETPTHLERRILAITARRPRHGRWFSVPLLLVALSIGAVACDIAQRGRTSSAPTIEPTIPADSVYAVPEPVAVEAIPVDVESTGGAAVELIALGVAPTPVVAEAVGDRIAGVAVSGALRVPAEPLVLSLAAGSLSIAASSLSLAASSLSPPVVLHAPGSAETEERALRARAAGADLMRMNRDLLVRNGLTAAIGNPSVYAWVVRSGVGPVIRSGIEWMPPPGVPWTDRTVVGQLADKLDGIWVRQVYVGRDMPLDDEGTRVNLVVITPRDSADTVHIVRGQASPVFVDGVVLGKPAAVHPPTLATNPPSPIMPVPRPAPSGIISGVITDPEGRVIPGASVTLQPLRRGAVTNHEGRFLLFDIPPGSYTLVGVRPNTGRMIRREVEVEGGERQTIHIVF